MGAPQNQCRVWRSIETGDPMQDYTHVRVQRGRRSLDGLVTLLSEEIVPYDHPIIGQSPHHPPIGAGWVPEP